MERLLLEHRPAPNLTDAALMAPRIGSLSFEKPQRTGPCLNCKGYGIGYVLFCEGRLNAEAAKSSRIERLEDGSGWNLLDGFCPDCYREKIIYSLMDQLEQATNKLFTVRDIADGPLRKRRSAEAAPDWSSGEVDGPVASTDNHAVRRTFSKRTGKIDHEF